MKHAGTLKIEILGPHEMPWSTVKPRLFSLRRTAAQALMMTMQDVHAGAVGEIRAEWFGESKQVRQDSKKWRRHVRNKLAENWKLILSRQLADRSSEPDAAQTYYPVTDALVGETTDNIMARFSGANLKDLVNLEGGFPSFAGSCAFYCEGRKAHIGGTPDQAILKLPLWGTGSKLTPFRIGPAGGSARALWRKLVADFDRRQEVVDAEKKLDAISWQDAEKTALEQLKGKKKAETDKERRKEIGLQMGALITAARSRVQRLKEPIETKLYGVTKLGRVGVVYDDRRRKWFATVSYTQYVPDIVTVGQKAALNFGVNVFIQGLAEDGAEWHEDGDQVLAKRMAGQSIRKRLQRSMRTFGRGSRGRGKARRELPLTKRKGDEARFIETYIRQLASEIIGWCKRHNVADLYIEEMTGIREQFERKTEGDAHPEVKRRIHHWPYYQTSKAIERQGAECSVRVHAKGAHYVSQRCPSCKHTAQENVIEVDGGGEPKLFEGRLYRRVEKWSRFQCQQCGLKGKGDVIACANHLLDVGGTHSLEKQQGLAAKAVKNIATTERKEDERSKRHDQVQRRSGPNPGGTSKLARRRRHAVPAAT
jgi:IS605 OrfB family transposase